MNRGVKKAMVFNPKWILTVDQDSYFKQDAVIKLLHYIDSVGSQKIGIVSPLHNYSIKQAHLTQIEASINKKNVVMASGNFVNVAAINTIGFWNESCSIDLVDSEFCLRLRQSGFEIHQLNQVVLDHPLGKLAKTYFLGKQREFKYHPPIRIYTIFRNKLHFMSKYFISYPKECYIELKDCIITIRNILLLEERKIENLKYIFLGIVHFFIRKFD